MTYYTFSSRLESGYKTIKEETEDRARVKAMTEWNGPQSEEAAKKGILYGRGLTLVEQGETYPDHLYAKKKGK